MYVVQEIWEGVWGFMQLGGTVLWFLAGLIFVMWTLLAERMWYYKTSLNKEINGIVEVWEARSDRESRHWSSRCCF